MSSWSLVSDSQIEWGSFGSYGSAMPQNLRRISLRMHDEGISLWYPSKLMSTLLRLLLPEFIRFYLMYSSRIMIISRKRSVRGLSFLFICSKLRMLSSRSWSMSQISKQIWCWRCLLSPLKGHSHSIKSRIVIFCWSYPYAIHKYSILPKNGSSTPITCCILLMKLYSVSTATPSIWLSCSLLLKLQRLLNASVMALYWTFGSSFFLSFKASSVLWFGFDMTFTAYSSSSRIACLVYERVIPVRCKTMSSRISGRS